MSNIIGMITVLFGAVAAGVSVWFVSKQHQRQQEQEHYKETERRLLAQLEQERHQREEIERQQKQEQKHHQETERRLLEPNQETTPLEHHLPSWESFNR